MNDYGILLTGTQSAQWYIKQMQIEYARIYNCDHFFSYLAIQCDFPPINNFLPHNLKAAAELIIPYFTDSALATCKYFILANITLHEALSNLDTPLPKSFISLENIIAQQSFSSHTPYYILGTAYSMESHYLKKIFQDNGAQLKSLTSDLYQSVDQLRISYYHQLNHILATNVFKELSKLDGIFIIACTELAMAYEDSRIKPEVLHLPLLQIQSLIKSAEI